LEVNGVAYDKFDSLASLYKSDEDFSASNDEKELWYLDHSGYQDNQIQQIMSAAGNFYQAGNFPLAETMYRQALEINPTNARILCMLGKVLKAMEVFDEALKMMQAALLNNDQNAMIHAELGDIYRLMHQPHEAMAHLVTGLELAPDSSFIHQTMGRFFASHHQLERAARHYRTCLTSDPANQDAMIEVAEVYEKLGRHGHAVRQYKRALEISPEDPDVHSRLIRLYCRMPDAPPKALSDATKRWAKSQRSTSASITRLYPNSRLPGRQLKVGYLCSPEERTTRRFSIESMLSHHEPGEVEVYYYGDKPLEFDPFFETRQTAHKSNLLIAQMVVTDQIDILVDLSGHGPSSHMGIFAFQPAPLQLSFGGLSGTTGLATVDYIITDRFRHPASEKVRGPEELVRMPHGNWFYSPQQWSPDVSNLPALEASQITYGYCGELSRLSEASLGIWSRIVCGTPGSRLMIQAPGLEENPTRTRLLSMFAKLGLPENRVKLVGTLPHLDMLHLYSQIDIGLDPFPNSDDLFTAEAMWHGVPVVVLHGETFSSRVSVVYPTTAGLKRLVTQDSESYVQAAFRLSEDLEALAKLRLSLRGNLRQRPTFQASWFVQNLETAYRHLWKQWCSKVTPVTRHLAYKTFH
jgi:predicted O-linked N-acetylglucosamine transferase (SPINDLY family)